MENDLLWLIGQHARAMRQLENENSVLRARCEELALALEQASREDEPDAAAV